MNTYSISYSTLACGITHIEADSENKAIEIFEEMIEEMSFNDLFETKEILGRIEVDEIQKI